MAACIPRNVSDSPLAGVSTRADKLVHRIEFVTEMNDFIITIVYKINKHHSHGHVAVAGCLNYTHAQSLSLTGVECD